MIWGHWALGRHGHSVYWAIGRQGQSVAGHSVGLALCRRALGRSIESIDVNFSLQLVMEMAFPEVNPGLSCFSEIIKINIDIIILFPS